MRKPSLLEEIEAFLSDSGMGSTYFGVVACGNSELVGRLRHGKTVTLPTADAVLAYIEREREARGLPRKADADAEQAKEQPAPTKSKLWNVANAT